ncbi:MAG: high-affinity branched-chain amino acid ABC transporter permease LivM [Deltaproteobacteria bacterium]
MSVLNSEKLPPILKDSVITGLITLVLAVPIVGLPTINATEGLQIEPRWSVVIWMVLAVFLGRLVLNLWWHREQTSSSSTILLNTPFLQSLQQLLKFIIPIGVLFALILPTMPFASRYVMDVAILVITYIMLGWGLNIVVGLAGLLDLGYVAFYAIGAYSYALLANYFDWSFWICLPLAGVFAAISGILLGFPVLRLRGDYLAIVTLGFGEIIRVILLNWYEFTGGPDGISGIPRPSFFGLEFKRSSEGTFSSFFGLDYSSMHRIIFLYYLILALALLTNFVTLRLRKLPVGRAWEALREDEIACRSLGINPTNTKLTAFAIGATFGGLAGSFFATRQGFISPESFTFIESAVILAIVVLGGMGSQIGVVLASVVLIGGTELFRELEEYRMLAFGALMVGIMVWKPRGLLAHREPTIRIKTEGSS